jgi:hypothetical protein|tara:strand:+ start:6729 stop:7097 length:369 start_codon:yes stop_codon:yes gene_type:complete
MTPFIKIKGGTLAAIKLKGINRALLNKASDGIHQAGLFVQGEVKLSVAGEKAEPMSVDTGRFLGSIETDNSKKLTSRVFSKVNYARYLEYGTSKIAPRKHFRNSLNRNKRKIAMFVEQKMKA